MLFSVMWMMGTDDEPDCIVSCGSMNMLWNTSDASERMSLKTWKLTPSVDRKIISPSGLSKGALGVGGFLPSDSDWSMVNTKCCMNAAAPNPL